MVTILFSIMVALLRDGEEIKSDIINDESTYTHTKEIDDEDVPIIAIHIDEIIRSMDKNYLFINGIFQISENFQKIKEGDSYGKMEINSITENQIKISNDESINLSKGDTISIMGDIKIKVADSDTVRFYPFQEIKVAVEGLPTPIPTPEPTPIPEFNIIILPVMVIIGLIFLLSGKKV